MLYYLIVAFFPDKVEFQWKIWISMKFAADIHGIQRMDLRICSDPRDHSCSTIISYLLSLLSTFQLPRGGTH